MFRNSRFYRRWWYIKRRNIRKLRLLLRLTLAALIMSLVFLVAQSNIRMLFGF